MCCVRYESYFEVNIYPGAFNYFLLCQISHFLSPSFSGCCICSECFFLQYIPHCLHVFLVSKFLIFSALLSPVVKSVVSVFFNRIYLIACMFFVCRISGFLSLSPVVESVVAVFLVSCCLHGVVRVCV